MHALHEVPVKAAVFPASCYMEFTDVTHTFTPPLNARAPQSPSVAPAHKSPIWNLLLLFPRSAEASQQRSSPELGMSSDAQITYKQMCTGHFRRGDAAGVEAEMQPPSREAGGSKPEVTDPACSWQLWTSGQLRPSHTAGTLLAAAPV